ncbi:YeaH/YhbH family protein [Chthonobacter rhizosphaerae]|uniref:YeaH/YhbH family protein n=1 Tax=Chthonobacter rhizosphaerae TaxID=2735553 RepID=UPI0015EF44A1|nr:YeaH/YhbH family protein [Chthonobacter rhizosphaerae]
MHIVDRRLNPGGKSFANRQRFLRRAKELVQRAVRESTKDRGIGDLDQAGEVSIPVDDIREPTLRRAGSGGKRDIVLPGNRQYVEGDLIERPQGGGGKGSGREGGQGDGEDAFRFVLTREEFLNIFLDDLELPDLAKRRIALTESEGIRRAGYTTSGSPANLALARTLKVSMSRRIAMRRPKADEIAEMEETLRRMEEEGAEPGAVEALRKQLESQTRRRATIPYLDPLDLRYRRYEPFPKPIAQAVMFCLMDVSGSMSEHMKDLAKRFFMLLHVFLTRRYKHVDVVFIRHTDKAKEVDEETFFRGTETGGTMVSSAFVEMKRVVEERYDPASWNIYAAQASDGDNMSSDGERTTRLLREDILPVCQYFAYLQVGDPGGHMGFMQHQGDTTLWRTYEALQRTGARFEMRRVQRREDIYPVFRQLFQKRDAAEGASP